MLARLDRALINTAFSEAFPNSSLSSQLGATSDHIPIILSIPTFIPKSHRF
jgi:exonuclease III